MAIALDGPAKALIVGLVAGGLLFAGGGLNIQRLQRQVTATRATCEEESKTSDFAALGGELICDPSDLAFSSTPDPPGVQGELARTQRRLRWWQDVTIPASLIIVIPCALPWTWYFLLRRLRELREAIIGR